MKRPSIISIICIIGYLSVLFTFPQVFSPPVKKLGVLMPALFGVLVATHFIACVGVWYFKQWGVAMYLLSFFARTLFYILTNQVGFMFFFGALVSLVSVIILLRFYKRMNPNL